ncbi:MAG TPA: IucA/IucC family protein [Trinickia sp.]|jgi:siderophore synthetase component|uniref:IucA/IucC family protein n=1 Tax=Trinickia sp. TaxID=2571163 RepID=UPI002CA48E96|nr:IucA/IucC family protein [Trinickia sp.]HTI18031.1 IucA/IucC family protein [Trinickia sp.]
MELEYLSSRSSGALAGTESQEARSTSHCNAITRLVRCFFAEGIVDKAALVFAPEGTGAWLPLWHRHALLFFSDLWRAPADTFVHRGTIMLIEDNGRRTMIERPAQLIDLLLPSFDFSPSAEGIDGLKRDVENSVENDALARVHRAQWDAELREKISEARATGFLDYLRHCSTLPEAALLLDRWGSLEGHPFYPTWKSKPDLTPAEVASLSPEFDSIVSVRVAALRADMAYLERMPHVGHYHDWFAGHFPQVWAQWKARLNARQLDERQWLPLPIHSWHLEHFVRREYAAEIDEGILVVDGPNIDTLPTMSFRTMMPRLPGPVPFFKLPIALWLTSEQRSLQAKSIHMGPRISSVIERILTEESGFNGNLEIFPEEVAFHYKHAVKQDDRPGRYLSVAFRSSKVAFDRSDDLLPVTVAALFTRSPVDRRPLMTELIEQGGTRASTQAVEQFFRAYAQTVTHPVIGIYLRYGIALEAHQQNTSVLFARDGTPQRLLIRDFGDGRTFAPLLAARGYEIKPYVHPGILPTVFDHDISLVRSLVLNACFVCHLHEIALMLTQEYGFASNRLWEVLREETGRTFDRFASGVDHQLWQTERTAFLDEPWPARSVLRMHLLSYSDYRLEHTLSNPLRPVRRDG